MTYKNYRAILYLSAKIIFWANYIVYPEAFRDGQTTVKNTHETEHDIFFLPQGMICEVTWPKQ